MVEVRGTFVGNVVNQIPHLLLGAIMAVPFVGQSTNKHGSLVTLNSWRAQRIW